MGEKHSDLKSLAARIGSEIGLSDWQAIDQLRIDEFARITGDRQYIHTDPEAAARTPFGGTIAHGYLVLSLLSSMFYEAVGEIEGTSMSMNYGFDTVRFLAPVRSGKRVRGRFSLKELAARAPQQTRLTFAVTVEIEGEDKPALVADWIVLIQ
ncbi:MaoC family dehydratase [Labrenzia sp. 011]|uniref:MaoC family dehydratase n=1 Tax=Labrenzia sp. 011 TaxID=2171494 RepID=UPI000D519290|nr:MaoC family dehydratase [Labrenzia sp. 011]PVB62935.1 nodulation protein NodN [Labrenzia sp. 011]